MPPLAAGANRRRLVCGPSKSASPSRYPASLGLRRRAGRTWHDQDHRLRLQRRRQSCRPGPPTDHRTRCVGRHSRELRRAYARDRTCPGSGVFRCQGSRRGVVLPRGRGLVEHRRRGFEIGTRQRRRARRGACTARRRCPDPLVCRRSRPPSARRSPRSKRSMPRHSAGTSWPRGAARTSRGAAPARADRSCRPPLARQGARVHRPRHRRGDDGTSVRCSSLGGARWRNRPVPAACFRKITIAVGNAQTRTRRHNARGDHACRDWQADPPPAHRQPARRLTCTRVTFSSSPPRS